MASDKYMESRTSAGVRVKIEVEPKSVVQTSAERLADFANRLIIRYPKASEPTEIMAIAASPLIFASCPGRRSKIANTMVRGRTRIILFVIFSTLAIAIAPNATCAKPSPMREKRRRTSGTPRSEEQSAMRTPTMSA